MNPSYNAGGINGAGGTAGVPGAKPGVIASGADAPEISAPAPSAPMSLNNSGRSGGSAKKWILIVAGIVIVALIVVLIVFAVRPRNGSGNGQTTNYSYAYSDFLDYADYYLGTTDFSKPYTVLDTYAAEDAIEAKNANFFEKAKEKYSTFSNVVNGEDTELKTAVDDYAKLLELVYLYSKITVLSDDDVLNLYNETKDKDATIDTVTKSYAGMAETTYQDISTAIEKENEYYKALVEMIALYDTNNCLNENEFNEECLISAIGRQSASSQMENLEKLDSERKDFDIYVFKSESALWTLNDLISGGSK